MYVRALHFVCRQDVDQDQVREVYREIISETGGLEGFRGSSLLMSDESCRGLALMYWRDPEAAQAASSRLVSLLSQHIHNILDHPPDISGYFVVEGEIAGSEDEY